MREYWYWITNINGVGRSVIDKLLEYYISPDNIYKSRLDELNKVGELLGIKKEVVAQINDSRIMMENYYRDMKEIESKGIYMIATGDKDYPKKLMNIYRPPLVLYVKGKLPDESLPSIAIVGARGCDEYGAGIAKTISATLAGKGFQVISGMAVGIDKYAHQGALKTGSTFGVLGCGVDICYPPINIELYGDICRKGGIISEYKPGTKPLKYHFPERNRIISGMSDGILVVQARKNSGSLITVKMGLEQGKDIYAIPGRVTDDLSKGCNELIKEGAKCVTCIEDIWEDYKDIFEKKNVKKSENKNSNFNIKENLLASAEKIVYANLRLESKHIEEIKKDTGMELPQVMEALITLQMKDMVVQTSTNYYALLLEEL